LASSAPISSRSGPACRGGTGGTGDDGPEQDRQAGAVERRSPLHGGIQGSAERPHVRRRADLAFELLRCHVLWRADHHPGAGELGGGVQDPCNTEIGDDRAAASEQDVVWLQVTVHDAGGVRVPQCLCHLITDGRHVLPWQSALLLYLSAQRLARDELHHDPWRAVLLDDVVDGDHAGVGKAGRRPRLVHRTGDEFSVLLRWLLREKDFLDRHNPVQELVTPTPYSP